MTRRDRTRVMAEEAARLMVDGFESEYLHAKQRVLLMLGMPDHARIPSNKKVKELISSITRSRLGDEEVKRRLSKMRRIALEIMTALEEYEPFLIGSTLSGKIRQDSDIDLHAYCDDFEILKSQLTEMGYNSIEEEIVENIKGAFVHLRWVEEGYPVEITVLPQSLSDEVPYSSVTGKPMKRADINGLKKLVKSAGKHPLERT